MVVEFKVAEKIEVTVEVEGLTWPSLSYTPQQETQRLSTGPHFEDQTKP